MKIKCDECGHEINWWETTESEGKLIACPYCDTQNKTETEAVSK